MKKKGDVLESSEEYKIWLRQSDRDIITAKHSLENQDYYASAFWAQQSAEKALKSAILKEKNELIKTHSIIKLARILEASKDIIEKADLFEPVHQAARYPDISASSPEEDYDKENTEILIKYAEEIRTWAKKKINL